MTMQYAPPILGLDAQPDSHWRTAAAHSAPATLVWSEYCYLICIALALLLVVVPPDWNIPGRRIVRQLPLLATLPLVALSVLGRRLSTPLRERRSGGTVLAALLPLTLLALWIVVGSAHARLVEGFQATFLNLGLYIVAAPAAALIMANSSAPTRLSQAYLRLLVVAACVMAAGLVAVYGHRELYHEQIFLLIPVAIAAAISLRNRTFAWLGCLFILGTALLSRKNTSYLIALLTVMYMAVFLWLNTIERAPSVKQLWAHYLAFVGLLIVAAGACYVLYFRHRYLPSGNVEFRSFTYRAAWQQFLDSPIWGTSFNAESIRKFTLYTVGVARNRLPTHSDVMDLLANGGLLAIGLWLWSYARAGLFAYKRVLAPRFLHYPWAAQAHTFAMISVAAVVVYAFNPILLQPEMAFLAWSTLGFLVGLAASCDPERSAGDIARRFHEPASRTVQP
jgi:hypothetical protein